MKADATSSSEGSSGGASQSKSSLIEEFNERKKRNQDMHQHFQGKIPSDDLCVAGLNRYWIYNNNRYFYSIHDQKDFTCAIKIDGLGRPGKLYLTPQHLLFRSFTGDTKQILHISHIESLERTNTLFLPSGLTIRIKQQSQISRSRWELQHLFFRDNCMRSIQTIMESFKALEQLRLPKDGSTDSLDRRDTVKIPRTLQRKISKLIDEPQEGKLQYSPLLVICVFSIAFNFLLFFKSLSL